GSDTTQMREPTSAIPRPNGERPRAPFARTPLLFRVATREVGASMVINRLDRRTFLRAAGTCIALPLLDAMLPVGLRAEQKAKAASPKRLLLINKPLGIHGPNFFPEKAGKDYEAPRYLKVLKDHLEDFTVFSGMSHRGYPGGHHTEVAIFTGVAPE